MQKISLEKRRERKYGKEMRGKQQVLQYYFLFEQYNILQSFTHVCMYVFSQSML